MFKTVITLYTNEKIPLGEELAKEVAYAFANGDVQVEYIKVVDVCVCGHPHEEHCPDCDFLGCICKQFEPQAG